jgi:hypothetical protein
MKLEDLRGPFNPAAIHWRVGATTKDKTSGIALAYIDARDVMERLDAVCSMAHWQARYPWSDGKRIVCEIGIKVGDEWIWKANGAGDTDVEAEKGAMSDAFKRAAVLWGVGQYLYDLPNTWMPLVAKGNSYAFSPETKQALSQRLDQWQKQYFAKRGAA